MRIRNIGHNDDRRPRSVGVDGVDISSNGAFYATIHSCGDAIGQPTRNHRRSTEASA